MYSQNNDKLSGKSLKLIIEHNIWLNLKLWGAWQISKLNSQIIV